MDAAMSVNEKTTGATNEKAREEAAAVEGATTEPKDAHPHASKSGQAHTSFLLIRHAESAANEGGYFGGQSDSVLTAKGVAQARALCAWLATEQIDVVYSSDLSRARDTVRELAAQRGLALTELTELRERSMGEFTGRSFEWVKKNEPALWRGLRERDPDAKPPGGESHREMAKRAASVLATLGARHRGQSIAVGTHGAFMNHLARVLLGVGDPEAARFYLTTDNASVTRIDLMHEAGGDVARLVWANRSVPAT